MTMDPTTHTPANPPGVDVRPFQVNILEKELEASTARRTHRGQLHCRRRLELRPYPEVREGWYRVFQEAHERGWHEGQQHRRRRAYGGFRIYHVHERTWVAAPECASNRDRRTAFPAPKGLYKL
jgi:hypothetical protein